ncbi:leucine-rich receptor-like protein kinase family protein [Striga asiatica]|uniref:non-specific serine/threonine protein kinase n=1 Tax=Striga asiatica TaxID=4170 RepID=A0A5A7R2Y5_STRAF|nr:leucine-rich receptor-like protein kinase family protein [Striga asiatica]
MKMENKNNAFLIIFSALLIILSTTSLSRANDQNALFRFKSAITSDPHRLLTTNWSTDTSFCQWIGVLCGTKHNNRVTSLNISGFALRGTLSPHLGNLTFLRHLDISSNNLTGPIPDELSRLRRLRSIDIGLNSFAGQIPTSFGALTQLEILRLNNNTFTGKIPDEIGNCSSLQILDMSYNQLTGSIPYGIFNLSSVMSIDVKSNQLSGRLPSDMCENLPNLKMLSLRGNQMEGPIPTNIGKCRELQILWLTRNGFEGEIPSEIASLRMLEILYLGSNKFEGLIPKKIGECTSLKQITMYDNHLTGGIPQELFGLQDLRVLDVGFNKLEDVTGNDRDARDARLSRKFPRSLPQELKNLAFLEYLSVQINHLSGSIPQSIFNISTLKELYLSFNLFSGTLPLSPDLSLSNLESLFLSRNELTGEIPISITNASNLQQLHLQGNSFTGFIPNFGSLRLLRGLYFWGNSLSGAESPNHQLQFISSLANCRFLEQLAIYENPLNGILPDSIGNLSKSLTTIWAESSNINGIIPSTIGNLTGLRLIDLSGNAITGIIPPTVGKLSKLQLLDLHDNQLSGLIPRDICGLSNIGDLYLYENNLTGPIPECLGDLRSLREIYLGSNQLNSSIPLGFWNLRDLLFLDLSSNHLSGQVSFEISSLKQLNVLDLSHNRFSGEIPGLIDGCQSLTILNLSDNRFERSIPPSMGNIRALRDLDLSNNNLSGLIPESLQGLETLEYFNVSYNELEGMIPTGGPFVNFSAQSFLHNSALCGDQRFEVPPCIENNSIRKSRRKKVERLLKYSLPPFFLAIIITIVMLVVLVRRQKRKRGPSSTTNVSLGVIIWRRISYRELERGTDGFSETNMLGNGSFGSVYKGVLSDGLNVAVKVFNSQLERAIRSFDTECEILSSIRHRNLVQIIGCCSNTEFKALVLEYMPNGSLEKWLYSENSCLDLMRRLQIAIDVASALEYLHHGHTFTVVHCDIKPSNVLLDEDMVAHLADFGIAKLFDDGETMVHTKTLATIGYAAPEYGSEGKVTTSADVYSFGILLLEMFTRKKPTDAIFNEEISLKEWVCEALRQNAVAEVVVPDLLASGDQHLSATEECVSSILHLAMKCLPVLPDERIDMIEAAAALQRIKAKILAETSTRQQYALSVTVT